MAAITLGVQTGDTADGSTYETGSFTPAADDLLVALANARGTVDAGAYTSSDAGKTYAKVTQALWGTNLQSEYAFVAEQLADADLQTGTMDVTGDPSSGCAQVILRANGMTKTGLTAIRQFKIVENQAAATTPEVIFDNACLTGNPTIFAVAKAQDTTVTAPTGWTNTGDIGFITPATRIVVATRDSGFTGTTITAGGTSDGTFAVIGIELDASAPAAAAPSSGGSWGYIGDRYRTPSDIRARRKREREELVVTKAGQRAIDRTAVKIAPTIMHGGLLDAPAVMAAPEFDSLLAALRPTDGQILALAQSILDRLEWIARAEEQEAAELMELIFELE